MDDIFVEVVQLYVSKGYNLDQMYFISGSHFCRVAAAMNKPVEQIISDIALTFKSLPPPIEETDESNQ